MVAKGDVWEGHELLSELDRGMVRTFLARQIGDTRDLVWLHLREGTQMKRDLLAEEIARLQRLSDEVPQIVRVLYGGISGSVAWVASSFQGEAIRLKEATRGADLGLTALKMVLEIGRCLVRAHELDAVHGALSPERVFITAEHGYAITQFGFVRLFQLTEEEAAHEPHYAAPELIFGGRRGQRTDVYGLGTVMYELLCQRELYSDREHRTQSLKTWEPSFPIAVPRILRLVMQKALAKEPRSRYPSVEQMLDVLGAIADMWEKSGSGQTPANAEDDALLVSGAAAGRAPVEKEDEEDKPIVVNEDWEPFASFPDDDGRATEPSLLSVPGSPEMPAIERILPEDITTIDSSPPDGLSPPTVESPQRDSNLPSLPVLQISGLAGGGTTRRRIPARLLGMVLALAVVINAAWAILWWKRPLEAVPRLAQVAAAHRSNTPCLLGPPDAPQESPAVTQPIAPQVFANHHIAFVRRALKAVEPELEHCDGVIVCGHEKIRY